MVVVRSRPPGAEQNDPAPCVGYTARSSGRVVDTGRSDRNISRASGSARSGPHRSVRPTVPTINDPPENNATGRPCVGAAGRRGGPACGPASRSPAARRQSADARPRRRRRPAVRRGRAVTRRGRGTSRPCGRRARGCPTRSRRASACPASTRSAAPASASLLVGVGEAGRIDDQRRCRRRDRPDTTSGRGPRRRSRCTRITLSSK